MITLIAGIAAWLLARVPFVPRVDSVYLSIPAGAFVLLGIGCSVLGVLSFRRARTTVNPVNPGAVTTLVVSGIYRFTRNPMYLGFLLWLLAEIVWLGSPLALLTAPAFVLYLNRFQIAPEENVLRERFGAEFDAYMARVPRWL